jgi:hypothetical protein
LNRTFESFVDKNISPEVQKLRYQAYEKTRQGDLGAVLKLLRSLLLLLRNHRVGAQAQTRFARLATVHLRLTSRA